MTSQFLIENSWLIAAAVLSGGMIVFQTIRSGGGASSISPAQATQLLNHKRAVLIDIRDDATVAQSGALPDAKRIKLDDLKARSEALIKNKTNPVIVACQVGQRSKAGVAVLKAAGFAEVYSLEGGVAAWVEAGLPIKKTKAA